MLNTNEYFLLIYSSTGQNMVTTVTKKSSRTQLLAIPNYDSIIQCSSEELVETVAKNQANYMLESNTGSAKRNFKTVEENEAKLVVEDNALVVVPTNREISGEPMMSNKPPKENSKRKILGNISTNELEPSQKVKDLALKTSTNISVALQGQRQVIMARFLDVFQNEQELAKNEQELAKMAMMKKDQRPDQ